MKTSLIYLPAIAIVAMAFTFSTGEIKTIEVGDKTPLPETKMKDVSGVEMSHNELMGEKGLLVIFSCNTCPFVIGNDGSAGWEGRYGEVGSNAKKTGIGAALINSNEAKRGKGDSFDDMVAKAGKHNFNMAYVIDINHVMADAFGARTTPHVFLFNSNYELVYKGAIDDNCDNPSAVKQHWIQNAMTNLSQGKAIDPNTTRNMGCSIKRVSKG